MQKKLQIFVLLLLACAKIFAQYFQPASQLKNFQQNLAATNLQFAMPKDFKEIKPLRNTDVSVDYAMELPNENFQVWYVVKNLQQELSHLKVSEDEFKRIHPDSLYSLSATAAAIKLTGKDYAAKPLPQSTLDVFHADRGRSYQLNLYNMAETNHYQYGLLICLQKSGEGYVSILFLGNENGPDFYKKVNKAYYAIRFN